MKGRIVIIGGMGPQASIQLHQKIIIKSLEAGAENNEDFPEILHFSIPVIDFISSPRYKEALRHIAMSLSAYEFDEKDNIGIACNTAHILQPHIEKQLGITMQSMIKSVVRHAVNQGFHKVGLLASPMTIRSKLYQDELVAHSLSCIVPGTDQQASLEATIRSILSGTADKSGADELLKITENLRVQGAEAVILGCTELPLHYPAVQSPVPVLDSLDVLADTLLHGYRKGAI